jgi:hypothetical protein
MSPTICWKSEPKRKRARAGEDAALRDCRHKCKRVQVKTLRYVIVDEVHNIVEVGRGAVYERTLALLPCPAICLSATVGNAAALWAWLEALQRRKGLTMAPLVDHRRRWSGLRLQARTLALPAGLHS